MDIKAFKEMPNYFNIVGGAVLKFFLLVFLLTQGASAEQGRTLDKIVAVVEDNVILQSEIEGQVEEMAFQQDGTREELRCMIIGEEIQQQLLLKGAEEEGIEVEEEQVESELDRRMNQLAMQVGGRQEIEEYYGSSVRELKEDFREPLRNQMIAQQMQQRIIGEVEVSPREVREFFNNIPEDELPYYDTEVEVSQVIIQPEITEQERQDARQRTLDIRERLVEDGESFETLAILYSDDDNTSSQGGELGFRERDNLEPEYAAAVFQLEPQEFSGVVETDQGFHIIQKLERRGQRINSRHILIEPSITAGAEQRARQKADSLKTAILNDEASFQEVAVEYSEEGGQPGGGGALMRDPETGSTRISVDNLPSQVFFAIEEMSEGEISEIVEFRSPEGGREFRFFKLLDRTPPHQANLDQDYQKIRQKALQEKRQEKMQQWLENRGQRSFIKVDEDFSHCEEVQPFMQQSP